MRRPIWSYRSWPSGVHVASPSTYRLNIQKAAAISTLDGVASNTSDRTVGYLAKKVVASFYVETGDAKKGQEMLQAMLKDNNCIPLNAPSEVTDANENARSNALSSNDESSIRVG